MVCCREVFHAALDEWGVGGRRDDGDRRAVGGQEAADVGHGDDVADASLPWNQHEVRLLCGAFHFPCDLTLSSQMISHCRELLGCHRLLYTLTDRSICKAMWVCLAATPTWWS